MLRPSAVKIRYVVTLTFWMAAASVAQGWTTGR